MLSEFCIEGRRSKEKTAKVPKEPKPAKERKERNEASAKRMVKELVARNPEISVDDIMAKLKEAGIEYKRSYVIGRRYETIHTMNILKELGKLK